MFRTQTAIAVALGGLLGLAGGPATAGSHLWRFNEVFSNADGTIQYVELIECCGADNEIFLANKWVASDALGTQYTFPENLPCTDCTANQHLLLATPAFAALPGAPEPDFLLPPEAFFAIDGDTLSYWMYPSATWSFGPVPADGVNALREDGSIAVNSPTNLAGATGSVTVPCHPADVDRDGGVDSDDLVAVILAWGANPGQPADIDGSGVVDVDDLMAVILGWGPCA